MTTSKKLTKKNDGLEEALKLLVQTQTTVLQSQKETNEKLDKLIKKLDEKPINVYKDLPEGRSVNQEDIVNYRKKKSMKFTYTVVGLQGKNPDGSNVLDMSTTRTFKSRSDAVAYGDRVFGKDKYIISQTAIPQGMG